MGQENRVSRIRIGVGNNATTLRHLPNATAVVVIDVNNLSFSSMLVDRARYDFDGL